MLPRLRKKFISPVEFEYGQFQGNDARKAPQRCGPDPRIARHCAVPVFDFRAHQHSCVDRLALHDADLRSGADQRQRSHPGPAVGACDRSLSFSGRIRRHSLAGPDTGRFAPGQEDRPDGPSGGDRHAAVWLLDVGGAGAGAGRRHGARLPRQSGTGCAIRSAVDTDLSRLCVSSSPSARCADARRRIRADRSYGRQRNPHQAAACVDTDRGDRAQYDCGFQCP